MKLERNRTLKRRGERVIPGGMYGHMSTYRLMPPRYPQYFERVAREMFNRGILMGARGLFGALSTPMGDVEIDRFLEAADGAAEYVLSA